MNQEISSSSPLEIGSASIGDLLRLLQEADLKIPQQFTASLLMRALFIMPSSFPTLGAKTFQPLNQIGHLQKRLEEALDPQKKHLFLKLEQFHKEAQPGKEMGKTSPFFPLLKTIFQECLLLKESFPVQEESPSPEVKEKPPIIGKKEITPPKLSDLLEQTKLAADFLGTKTLPEKIEKMFTMILSMKENFQMFLESMEREFSGVSERGFILEIKGTLEHLEKALRLMEELAEMPRASAEERLKFQEKLLSFPKDLQKILKEFSDSLINPLEKSLKKLAPEKKLSFSETQRSSERALSETSLGKEKIAPQPRGHFFSSSEMKCLEKVLSYLFQRGEASPSPKGESAPTPTIPYPHSLQERRSFRLKRGGKKKEKGKREERPLSYLDDFDYE